MHALRCPQAYSISKLVSPTSDHKPLAQGLADALFGQGKVQEAKTVLRAAGLTKKGMKQSVPTSYLRCAGTGQRYTPCQFMPSVNDGLTNQMQRGCQWMLADNRW